MEMNLRAGITFGQDGDLYGTTNGGGINDWGAVYRLKPPTKKGQGWKEKVLYSFDPNNNGIIRPEGPVTFDSAGNMYGTTPYGGDLNCAGGFGCGVVFELSPPTQKGKGWTFTSLYAFQDGNDGAAPRGYMVFDSNGNLYGTTQTGGGSDHAGIAFRLKPPANTGGWTETVLHTFLAPAGAGDTGGLAWGKWGHLYGVTEFGGTGSKAWVAAPHSSFALNSSHTDFPSAPKDGRSEPVRLKVSCSSRSWTWGLRATARWGG